MTLVVGAVLWAAVAVATALTNDPILVPNLILLGTFLVPVCTVLFVLARTREAHLSVETLVLGFLAGGTAGVALTGTTEVYVLPDHFGTNALIGLVSAVRRWRTYRIDRWTNAHPRPRRRGPVSGFRIELFVADVDASIRFYEQVLGFQLERRESDYASLRRGGAVLGLGPIAKLPAVASPPGFSQERLAGNRGSGVEIVLEVDDLDAALARVERAGAPLAEPLQQRPWGLRDFRLADPDGYYLRLTTRG